MLHVFFLPSLATSIASSPAFQPRVSTPEVREQFVELAEKQDHDACLALWTNNPEAVLQTIDADLEGSLALREKSGKSADAKAIAALHARALWGAQIALEASGDPMILDYTSAFVGWDDTQRKRFRAGQSAFRTAIGELKKGDPKAAFAAAQTCLDNASRVGDWWGTAMACDALTAAHKAMNEHEWALEAAARARSIYHSLGLAGDEYAAATAMTDLCVKLKRVARGRAACQVALALARKLGDEDGEKSLLAQQAVLDRLPAGK